MQISVRDSNYRTLTEKSKIKRMLGGDNRVQVDEGIYMCDSFCHLLKISGENINKLVKYYK
jgi:hypothetical protein